MLTRTTKVLLHGKAALLKKDRKKTKTQERLISRNSIRGRRR